MKSCLELINKLEAELKELNIKIEKGKKGLERFNLDEIERELLTNQLNSMINCSYFLSKRIEYLANKITVF